MRELTIADIKGLENGEYIPSFCGTIEKVYEQKHGDGDYGAWSLQNMIVKDETGKVQVTWGGEDDLSKLEGQTRIFESSQTKHGLRGCRWEAKVKNGTRYEGVKLTDTCKIKPISTEQEPESSNASAGRFLPDATPAPLTNHEGSTNGINEARQHLCQAANLYNLCVKAVDAMIAPELPEVARTSEQFQAAVGTLFIEASRAGLVAKMPIKPIHNGNEKGRAA